MLYSVVVIQIHFYSLETFENDIGIEARLNLAVLRPRHVYQSHVMCSDEREMGGWMYKGQYDEDCLLHITHFAYQMCKSAETVCHSMALCVECIVE